MVRERIGELVAREPADSEVDLRLPHQLAIVHYPVEQPRYHQPDRRFRVDSGPAVVEAVEIGDLTAQP